MKVEKAYLLERRRGLVFVPKEILSFGSILLARLRLLYLLLLLLLQLLLVDEVVEELRADFDLEFRSVPKKLNHFPPLK